MFPEIENSLKFQLLDQLIDELGTHLYDFKLSNLNVVQIKFEVTMDCKTSNMREEEDV